MFGSSAGNFSFSSNKPAAQSSGDLLLSNIVQFPPTTKYLDLNPDLKGILDELEKKIYTNDQLAQQFDSSTSSSFQVKNKIQECSDKTMMLHATVKLVHSSFQLDQTVTSEVQSNSAEQFKVAELSNHTLSKVKTDQMLQHSQYKFLDDYLAKMVESFDQKIKNLSGLMTKIESSLKKRTTQLKDDKEIEEQLKTVVQMHNTLLFKFAGKISLIQDTIGRETERIMHLRMKYPQLKMSSGFLDISTSGQGQKLAGQSTMMGMSTEAPKYSTGSSLLSPFKPISFPATPNVSVPTYSSGTGSTPFGMGNAQPTSYGSNSLFGSKPASFNQPSGQFSFNQSSNQPTTQSFRTIFIQSAFESAHNPIFIQLARNSAHGTIFIQSAFESTLKSTHKSVFV